MQPAPTELKQFMDAIAQVESSDNYQAIGSNRGSRYGVAQGRYQIMSEIWPSWAKEAGYSGLTTQQYLNSPEVQDAIAAKKMSQYYDRYDGDWGLVAAAWFSGIGNADKAKRAGVDVLASVNDSGNDPGSGINVPTYIGRVLSAFGKGGGSGGAQRLRQANPSMTASDVQRVTQNQVAAAGGDVTKSPRRRIAQSAMQRMSDLVKANPGSPDTHATVRKAMEAFVGKDSVGGTQGVVRQQGSLVTANEGSPTGAPDLQTPPTEAPGVGQSGVR